MRFTSSIALLLLPLLASAPAAAQSATASPGATQTLRFYGYAYDAGSDDSAGKYLYTEVHEQQVVDGRWAGGSITYYRPDGERFGYKTLDFSSDPYIPEYRLELPQQNYVEAITDASGPVRLQRRKGETQAQTASVEKQAPMCADSGFHSLLVANFDRLLGGETFKFRMAVAGSLDAFKFRARRVDDTTFEGRPAVRFKVELDSLFRLLIDPLELVYDPQTRQLLQYTGVSNIRDPDSGDQYVARIAYYSQPPAELAALPPLGSESLCDASSSASC